MAVAAVFAQQCRGMPVRQVRLLGHGQIGVGGVQRPGVSGARLGGAQRQLRRLRQFGESMISGPSSRRSVVSTARSRASRTASGEATDHTAGRCRATSSWLKL